MRKYLVCWFVVSCLLYSMSDAAISLTANGQVYDTLPMKVGQAIQVEIRSEDTSFYEAYIGFDDGTVSLGTLNNPTKYIAAGSAAYFEAVLPPMVPLTGYYVMAAGTGRAAGLHFSFTYTAEVVGQTTLKLYDSAMATVDSIVITVEPAQTGTGFTYQGRLLDENHAADGFYDMSFALLDAPSQGGKVSGPIEMEDVEVIDGFFVVTLDFGDVFSENACWLQTAVRPGDSTGDYITLTPRQRMTPAPHAAYAAKSDWNSLVNIPDDFADGIDNGLLSESDPTVPAFLKDGLSWSEIASIPAGFSDGVDNDTILSETQIETFIANDVTPGYVPYNSGTKLVTSPFYTNGQETAIGSGTYADRKFNVTTNSDLYAIYSDNTKTSGNNYGVVAAATGNTTGVSYGLFGAGLSAGGTNFGVYGTATTASSGINYGVYGTASNSSGSAYAGYFSGDVRTTGVLNKDYDLRIASEAGAEVAIGTGIDSIRKLNLYTDTDTYGLFSENALSGGERYGLYGIATGDTNGYSYGVYGRSNSSTGYNFGVWGEATTDTPYTNYAIFGTAANSGGGNAFAGYFMGDVRVTGVLNKDYALQIAADDGAEVGIGTESLSDRKLYVYSDTDTYGIYSSITGGNPLIGGTKYGIYGSSNSSACTNYGVYGKAATDSQNVNYGIYGYARNNTGAAWAGYFDGNVYVTSTMSAGTVVDRTPYPRDLETAYTAVMSMERLPDALYREDDKEQQLDHAKLSDFIRSEDGHRDLSAAVSCLNEVVKDLIQKVETQQQMIETQNQQIRHLTEMLQVTQNSVPLITTGSE